MEETVTHFCPRCKRERPERYLIERKNRAGKLVWRCRARSVCSSIGRRKRAIKEMK